MKSTTRHTISIIGVVFLAALVTWIIWVTNVKNDWTAISDEFVKQTNTLGMNLNPGAIGTFDVVAPNADELILLPAYCSSSVLEAHFRTRSSEFAQQLLSAARDDRNCPALVWVRDGRIISVNPVQFSVGVDLTLLSWPIHRRRIITVAKELETPNSFFSLRFVDDGSESSPH